MSLYSRYFTTKNQVICILFFTYIYDLVRAGFLESRRKNLRLIRLSAWRKYNLVTHLLPLSAASHHLPPFDISRPKLSLASGQFLTDSQHEEEDEELTANQYAPARRRDSLLGRVARGLNRILAVSSEKSSPLVSHRHCGSKVAPNALHAGQEETAGEADADSEIDACPLEDMHVAIRFYQHLSHCLLAVSFVKYLALNLFYAEMFGLQKLYSCYVPGRTAVLPEFSPSFPLVVLLYHVIYRIYLLLVRKSFHIDCFLFVLYDEQRVRSVELRYIDILRRLGKQPPGRSDPDRSRPRSRRRRRRRQQSANSSDDESDERAAATRELHELVAGNRMFFIRSQASNGEFSYQLRGNRSLKQWLKLRKFYHQYALVCASNLAIWSLPLALVILFTLLSENNFKILYSHCERLSDELNPMKWTWSNWRRYVWLFFDIIDNFWLLLDTANALVWPFSSMVFCAQDLTYSIVHLIESLNSITLRLEQWLCKESQDSDEPQQAGGMKSPMLAQQNHSKTDSQNYGSIHADISALQVEISDTFRQVELVDEYISKLASFCIFCWIVTNIYYQIMCLSEMRILIPSAVIQFMQVTAFMAISISYAYLSITHSKSMRLYDQICNIAAIDQNPETKTGWLWVLEYYHDDRSRYSLHMGPFVEMTLSNYLKSISWLITGACVTISLFIQKHQIIEADTWTN